MPNDGGKYPLLQMTRTIIKTPERIFARRGLILFQMI